MIDYCTFLTTDLEKEYLSLQFNSLSKFCSLDNFNIRVSVPEDRPDLGEYIKKYTKFNIEICFLSKYFQEKGPLPTDALNYASFDNANRMKWFMDNAKSEWVAISHLDIIYTQSFLDFFNRHVVDDTVGMFGIYQTGLCVIRKKAYDMTHCEFWQILDIGITPFTTVPYLTSMRDDYYHVANQRVDFLDVSDMLKIQMRNYGWKFVETQQCNPFHHVGQQSGHTIDLEEYPDNRKEEILRWKREALETYKHFLE